MAVSLANFHGRFGFVCFSQVARDRNRNVAQAKLRATIEDSVKRFGTTEMVKKVEARRHGDDCREESVFYSDQGSPSGILLGILTIPSDQRRSHNRLTYCQQRPLSENTVVPLQNVTIMEFSCV